MAAEDRFVGVRRPQLEVDEGALRNVDGAVGTVEAQVGRRRAEEVSGDGVQADDLVKDPTTLGVAAGDETGPQLRALQQVPRSDRDELAGRSAWR